MNIQTVRFLPTRFFTLLTAVAVGTLFMMTTVGTPVFAQSGNATPQVQTQPKPKPKPKRGIVGQQAPKWETSKWIGLPTGKKSFDINDVKGKVTYLYFFQSWCPGCHQRGFPTLKALEKKFRDKKDVQFVAIQTTFEGHRTNTPDKLEVMSKRYDLKIPFGQSKGNSGTPKIMRQYRSGGTPWVVVIDKQGKVVFNDFHIDRDVAANAIEQLRKAPSPSATATPTKTPALPPVSR